MFPDGSSYIDGWNHESKKPVDNELNIPVSCAVKRKDQSDW